MSFPFFKGLRKEHLAPATEANGRLIGETFDGQPIWAPKGHSLLLSANGGGKSTCGALPWLFSILASDPTKAIAIYDSKNAEIAAQTADMIAGYGRKVAIIDDMVVMGADNPYRVSLNPLGAVVASFERGDGDLVFSSENANVALIPEPERDERNAYWRQEPRTLIEFATYVLMKRNPRLAIPGGVWALLGNPIMLRKVAEIEASEGDEMLKVLAMNVLEMSTHEHFAQHRSAALKSLRIFAAGTRLSQSGSGAKLTHADLIRQGYVIFIVGPQAYMSRLGAYYALHILAFNEALYQGAGGLIQILDEFTNAPLKPQVESLTTLRAFGAECHMIAQSRSEIGFERERPERLDAARKDIIDKAGAKTFEHPTPFGTDKFNKSEIERQAVAKIFNDHRSNLLGIKSDETDGYESLKQDIHSREGVRDQARDAFAHSTDRRNGEARQTPTRDR